MVIRKQLLVISLSLAAGLILYSVISKNKTLADPYPLPLIETHSSNYFYGFDDSAHNISHDTIKPNEFVGDILLPYMDSTSRGVALIYEQDPVNYTILHLGDSLYASSGQKPIRTEEAQSSGTIESSLSLTLSQQGLSQALALEMAEIFAWSIDFYRLQKGDSFEVLYDKQFIEDEFIGIGELKACIFSHKGQNYKAFSFEQNGRKDFFDEEGEGLRKAFLQSPLKFGRLTSGFTNRRFHPVQRRFKAHKGTDYAAPRGTPILATGDGQVTQASYTRGNGKYVKIKHNGTYSTQYLHMSKQKVKAGQFVKQGETIGYVGSTGLATGPHVCYRFWKNGKQVDHRQEKFPSTDPILPENMETYLQRVVVLENKLSLGENSLAELESTSSTEWIGPEESPAHSR